jgi:hypothetical protein
MLRSRVAGSSCLSFASRSTKPRKFLKPDPPPPLRDAAKRRALGQLSGDENVPPMEPFVKPKVHHSQFPIQREPKSVVRRLCLFAGAPTAIGSLSFRKQAKRKLKEKWRLALAAHVLVFFQWSRHRRINRHLGSVDAVSALCVQRSMTLDEA